uniref:Uncharacterized protein n=1 Tax=Anguilla anguilla TaxID=7936 RepID=A0A0E9PDE7_ANGAN
MTCLESFYWVSTRIHQKCVYCSWASLEIS